MSAEKKSIVKWYVRKTVQLILSVTSVNPLKLKASQKDVKHVIFREFSSNAKSYLQRMTICLKIHLSVKDHNQ